ncbi:hypothetical protein G6F59_017509 [Rhizopus arrhizus]|nr:hypothetical protein G6F59_017509 [Rhizopus arrhizus]
MFDLAFAAAFDTKAQRRESAAAVDRCDDPLRRPGRASLNDVQVLHDHQRVGAHALGHVQRDNGVGQRIRVLPAFLDVAEAVKLLDRLAVGDRHQGAAGQ